MGLHFGALVEPRLSELLLGLAVMVKQSLAVSLAIVQEAAVPQVADR